MRQPPEDAAPIESGCWRESRGRRRAFDMRLVTAHANGDRQGLAARIATSYPWRMESDRRRAVGEVLAALERGEVPEYRLAQSSGEWSALSA